MSFTRRHFLNFTARMGAFAGASAPGMLLAQGQGQNRGQARGPAGDQDPRVAIEGSEKLFPYSEKRATVALVKGDSRRQNVQDALTAIDDQVQAGLRTKKSVVVKVNCVSPTRQLAATHADALHGLMDYLEPRYKGPVAIVECCSNPTLAFDTFGYRPVVDEHKSLPISLVDLNVEGKYTIFTGIDFDLHPVPIRLAARLTDPDAYVINVGPAKTHNMAIATLSVKNQVLGAPLQSAAGETPRWNDKRKYHVGLRQSLYNMAMTARFLSPSWGATVIDAFEGMEGNGPGGGTPVDQRVAIASTDFIAADRVGVECMGIDPSWIGYLNYCHQMGIGQYDISKIDLVGPRIAEVQKKYLLHNDVDRQLMWRGEMLDMPPNLG